MAVLEKKKLTLKSWARCERYGLNINKGQFVVQDKRTIENTIKSNHDFIRIAEPLMETLYWATNVNMKRYVVILTDSTGVVLKIVTSKDIRQSINSFNFHLFVSCAEKDVGTNGIGTALAINEPVEISGEEHYCICHHPWITAGAPIHNEKGGIIGCIGCCGNLYDYHPHTLGMLVASANAIEEMIKLDTVSSQLELYNNFLDNSMNSLSDGIISFNPEGKVIIINNKALQILAHHNKDEIKGEKLLPKGLFDKIIRKTAVILNDEIYLNTKNGKEKLFVVANPITNSKNEVIGVITIIKDHLTIRNLANKVAGAYAKYTFEDIIGSNESLLNTIKMGQIASKSSSNIIIQGETGTGKELIAQAIHNNSKRRTGPFLALNCASIPKELLESELFGYEEGTFTGAVKGGKPGKFEMANSGTLLLDEIGDMPVNMQSSFLRVLQEGTVTRLGSSKNIPVNVRIIASTNKNLNKLVKDGFFREDLFFRLNVLSITMPPLRNRKDDIPLLANYFVNRLAKKYNKNILGINDLCLEKLLNYNWPGNVRELENILERCVNLCENNSYIKENHLPQELLNTCISGNDDRSKEMMYSLEEIECLHIRNILKTFNYNKTKTAHILGIDRSSLYRKIEKYNIKLDE